jgi:hypothetical protein
MISLNFEDLGVFIDVELEVITEEFLKDGDYYFLSFNRK